MELWYTDQHTKNVRFSMKVEQQIASCESEFQRIDILKTSE
ncbi:MAG: spermidine synthase, partial [Clostridia bacterium]|nr:spermidine synthase [Clostridia bacterium]